MHLLALDQGTTSSRSIVFSSAGKRLSSAQRELRQIYPRPGEVEHDPEQIWKTQLTTARAALRSGGLRARDIAAIGITNQRETVVVWERSTGAAIGNAIVWQSRVTAPMCADLRASGCEDEVHQRTGLLLDPYFSGTKIKHILDRNRGLRRRAARGEILCGTIDTFLLWRLTGGRVHATDPSNASRTMLFNIQTLQWDEKLLRILDVPREMLPEVRDSSGVFGETERKLLGASIPIAGIAGDQQAATFGQACFRRGMAKNTYGTGGFLLLNTGEEPVLAKKGLLTTIGWSLGGRVTYCLEGSVFTAGAAVQWLRDGLGLIRKAADVEALAASVPDSGGVHFVPAFTGLGTPHWDPHARGTITGLTRGSTAGHLARATLEALAFQTEEVARTMQDSTGIGLRRLRVDGGASANNLLMQIQADLLGTPVERPGNLETTALGAAWLAGLGIGAIDGLQAIRDLQEVERTFTPALPAAERRRLLAGWQAAVRRARSTGPGQQDR